ncbi:MAG: preprotein translocase subunit TatB [Legionellaceae bacterium]|nr:preprotein translocase subunit TatB [Legionellaceae bacterium]
MNLAECLLTLLVALLVFNPKQLPMLVKHLAKVWRMTQRSQTIFRSWWDEQLKHLRLQENEHKAQAADQYYQHRPSDSKDRLL